MAYADASFDRVLSSLVFHHLIGEEKRRASAECHRLLSAGGELPKWLAGGDLLVAGWNGAIQPFIVWDVLKMAFAAVTVAGAWQLVKSRA